MASAPAEIIPQLSQIDMFLKKKIFPLFVVGFLGGAEEGQPGGPRGQVLEFPEPWLSLNQTPLLFFDSWQELTVIYFRRLTHVVAVWCSAVVCENHERVVNRW
jgi:hypothetical protein